MSDTPHEDDNYDEEEDRRWCEDERQRIVDYLVRESELNGLKHGEVGEWPAWHVAPIVAIWAVESVAAPGAVGWWVISGDMPCDYCSARAPVHPRTALKDIADGWLQALARLKPGDETIGATALPAHLAPLLKSRAETLAEWVDDEDLWADLTP